jgi:hypothetical protein
MIMNRGRRNFLREISHLSSIYALRNRLFLSSLDLRIDFLEMGIKDLYEAVRQDRLISTKQVGVGRVFSRLVCTIEYFDSPHFEFPFIEMLSRKYPAEGCAYCSNKPCECKTSRRPDYKLAPQVNKGQVLWSVEDWQNHLREVYGVVNQESSWDTIINRLDQEVREVTNVLRISPHKSAAELPYMYAKEIGDTFAWLCAAASRLELSLDKGNEMIYGHGCGACGKKPCACGPFRFDFMDWEKYEKETFSAIKS